MIVKKSPRFVYVRNESQSLYQKLVDAFFFVILLAEPFSTFWLDSFTGEGRFLSTFILLFGLMTIPIWKLYYSKLNKAIVFLFIAWFVGVISDFLGGNSGPVMHVLIVARQMGLTVYISLVVYNMTMRDSRNIKRFVLVILIATIISALFMDMNWGVQEGAERGLSGIRYSVLGQNSNATARSAAIGIIISFLLFFSKGSVPKIINAGLFLALPVFVMALVKTASRSGVLFLAMAFPACVLTTKSDSKKVFYSALICVGTLGMLYVVLSSTMLRERLLNSFYERDTGGREAFFYMCIEMFKQAPILGYGIAGHSIELGYLCGVPERATHCMYTYPLVAMGLLGTIPYFAGMISILRDAWSVRYYQYGNCLFVIVVFAFFSGIAGNLEYLRTFFVIFGLVLAAAEHSKRMGQSYLPPEYI